MATYANEENGMILPYEEFEDIKGVIRIPI